MKTLHSSLVVFFLMTLVSAPVKAQSEAKAPGMTVGMQLTEVGQNYGVGLNASSPTFASGVLAVRATATMHYYEIPGTSEAEMVWSRFGQFRLGMVSNSPVCACGVRVYGETGPVAVRPNSAFSNGNWQVGWYGLFGAEFELSRNSLFFFEMGGQGVTSENTGIRLGGASFGNGFIASAGYRIQFFPGKK